MIHVLRARPSRRRGAPRGFTLVEIMIVVLILAILATVTTPALLSATTPLPQSMIEVVEIDMRRARIEAIARIQPVHLIVGAGRDRWWLANSSTDLTPIDGTERILGVGALGPFAGYRLEVRVNGGAIPSGNQVIAQFDAVGTRDNGEVRISLFTADSGAHQAGSWFVEPERTKFQPVPGP